LPATDLPLLAEAAREAGRLALSHWRDGPEGWEKAGGEGLVTRADLDVDALLRDRLTGARTDYGWLSEESPDEPARLAARRVFVVDPIDGTRSFAAGESAWAISLAIAEAGAIVAAVIHLPALGLLYSAAAGAGAHRDGARLSASRAARLDGSSLLAPRSVLDARHWRGPAPAARRAFRPSIAYRIALVAEGRYDAMMTFRDSWEWDVAAGALIAAEAGAAVTDRTGAPLRFNTPHRQTPGLIAAPPALHAEALSRLT
jgi:myo-inositol-1(or 4)-monophosphatase